MSDEAGDKVRASFQPRPNHLQVALSLPDLVSGAALPSSGKDETRTAYGLLPAAWKPLFLPQRTTLQDVVKNMEVRRGSGELHVDHGSEVEITSTTRD